MAHKLRCIAMATVNAGLLALIELLFWMTDWQYALPTPRPAGRVQMATG